MTSIPRSVEVRMEGLSLEGILNLPAGAPSIVLFAHGSGSTRHSPRNAFVARVLNRAGFATPRFDLLTPLDRDLAVVKGATHLFEEPGALRKSATSACDWFRRHLPAMNRRPTSKRGRPPKAAGSGEAHDAHAPA